MHNLDLIMTLTGALAAALALGYVTHRLGLSPIVGYLLGGIVIGPQTPGFVANREIAEQLAEVGVILLMFGVGLHFHLKELLAVRWIAIPGAVAQSLFATALGVLVTHFFGWSWSAGIVFGLAISVASTVVLVRVLTDNRDLHTPTGHIAVGWLVVEDLLTVIVLVLLPVFFGKHDPSSSNAALTLGFAVLKIGALVGLLVVVGDRLIPKLLEHIVGTRSRELFTLTILVVALGIAVLSAKVFGVSMALGAFLAGMVVGRSDFSLRAASEALPMRDAFAVLFFVSVGMLVDPRELLEAPWIAAATLAIVMIGKPAIAFAVVMLLRHPLRIALAVAIALAQIGEFSFILATLARNLGVFPHSAVNTLVAVAIVSITLNPLLYRLINPLEAWVMRNPRLSKWLTRRVAGKLTPDSEPHEESSRQSVGHRSVVVGYGPIGQTVTRLLRENGIEPAIIELNLETVRRLREDGLRAIYGNASDRETLLAAGLDKAHSLILSTDAEGGELAIRLAREMNPAIRILARTAYLRNRKPLIEAGAQTVFSGEGEVALAFTESILRGLGSTPEEIDRARGRVHAELFGSEIQR